MMARRIRGFIAMFLVFAFAVSACSSDDTFLPALLADPMASYQAEGINLVDRQTGGYVKDPFFGKYSPAEVESEYRIADVARAEMRLDEAVKAAEAADWEMEESPTVPGEVRRP